MNATEILVIILSIVLVLFLVAGIILVVLLIKVTLQIRRITTKAETATRNFETFSRDISSVASRAMLGRIIAKSVRAVYRKKNGGRK